MKPLVSVIIPYYNNENTIIRAIKSVLSQTYTEIELILINDGSVDNSYNLVNEFIEKNEIKINLVNIEQKNLGPSVARNKGILLAKGMYVAFLDADDTWEKEKLQAQIDILNKNPKIDMLGCNFYINIQSEEEKIKKYFVRDKLRKISFNDMLYKHFYATPCVIVKRSVILDVGMFNESQRYMEDSLLFTKIARDYEAYMTNDFLVNTYKKSFGESGLSGNIDEMQKYELQNFNVLYKDNSYSNYKMSIINYLTCYIFSILKFIRRKILVSIRK